MTEPLRPTGNSGHVRVCLHLCPHLAQVHDSRLRIPQVSLADSGEYVCRVETESGPKEASIIVSVLHSTHSGPSHTPGEKLGSATQGRALGSLLLRGRWPCALQWPHGKGISGRL